MKVKKAALPQVKDIEIQPVRPAADFAAALAAYEGVYAPLDLPAMRGWKTAMRKALPGPAHF
jgi:hypothetical protein